MPIQPLNLRRFQCIFHRTQVGSIAQLKSVAKEVEEYLGIEEQLAFYPGYKLADLLF